LLSVPFGAACRRSVIGGSGGGRNALPLMLLLIVPAKPGKGSAHHAAMARAQHSALLSALSVFAG
jgi:hypothetical protein